MRGRTWIFSKSKSLYKGRAWNFSKSQSLYGGCEIQYIDILLHILSYFRHIPSYFKLIPAYFRLIPSYFPHISCKQNDIFLHISHTFFHILTFFFIRSLLALENCSKSHKRGGLIFHKLTPGVYSLKFFKVPRTYSRM